MFCTAKRWIFFRPQQNSDKLRNASLVYGSSVGIFRGQEEQEFLTPELTESLKKKQKKNIES